MDDGLYWSPEAESGVGSSPFGPPVAGSAAYLPDDASDDAYHGYHFRTLTLRGTKALGGAYRYVIAGREPAGFAMVAYPAWHARSGLMTFIISRNGTVFEKDLGTESATTAASLTAVDPGPGWTEVTPQ